MATAAGFIPSIVQSRQSVPLVGTTRQTLNARGNVSPAETVALPITGPGVQRAPSFPQRTAAGRLVFSPLEETWFQKVHVFPRILAFGNILSTIVDTIVIFNAFLDQAVSWSALAENAGSGVTVAGSTPPPDVVIDARDGLSLTLSVSPLGPPTIDGTLDFTFAGLYTVPISLTGSRLVVFSFPPEKPVRERLRWLTSILDAISGVEQRIANRGFPRQEFILDFVREEGTELTRFDNTVFDWQARIFGFPIWWEPTTLSADILSGVTTVPVASTAFADYRIDGLAMVFTDEITFDVLEIDSFDATSITFKSPTGRDFSAGTMVMPVRTCRMTPEVSGSRARVNRATRRVTFRVIDNDVGDSFPDASPYSTFDGLVLLDDPNAVEGQLRESMLRRLVQFDSGSGAFTAFTPWAQPRRTSAKGFRPRTRQATWELRRLLHFLRGRQVSFYLPTFYRDMIPVEIIQGGTNSLIVEAAGFAQFIQVTRPNRSIIRLETTSGDVQIRVITATGSLTQNREGITIDAPWDAGDLNPSDVSRITFFERVRIAQDDVEIVHRDNMGQADVSLPVQTVFDS